MLRSAFAIALAATLTTAGFSQTVNRPGHMGKAYLRPLPPPLYVLVAGLLGINLLAVFLMPTAEGESHGYQARESILHLMWESDTWLDRYVKNAPPRLPPSGM